MDSAVIMGIVPSGMRYPPGTPVWGTDYNAAYALLLRWWSVLDAPVSVKTAPFWDTLADDDLTVDVLGLRAGTRDFAMAAIASLRADSERSHRLGFDDLTLAWLDTDSYRLDAEFVEQTRQPGATVITQRCAYRAVIRKRADGQMTLRSIDGEILGAEPEMPFAASYAINRAKATMVQFQTHTDLLTGDATGMRELLMPDLELNGLVNSKADETRGDDATFTDVRSLRETISTSELKQDNVIRTFAEFSAWFASCTALFRPNGFHKLERFEVEGRPDGRFQVVAQFRWQAETINGAKIDLHTPLTWILVETGEKYMRIEQLLPFG